MTHKAQMLAEAALLAERLTHGDKLIAASKRAARIVDRVLPVPPMGVPKFDDLTGFFDRSRRFGERNALYKAILPRMTAKAVSRPCAALHGSARG